MSFTSIPILDLDLSRDPATKPEFLNQLRHALMEVGFLYLKNVGISQELWDEIIKEGKSFFDIPQEEKYGSSFPREFPFINAYAYTPHDVFIYELIC
jgi:isopenicillin N synthase-like dioxygenase